MAVEQQLPLSHVRKIFKNIEKIIFNHLSSTSPDTDTVIKLIDGLSIECKHNKEKHIKTFDELNVPEKIWARAKMTRHYNRKLNNK